MSNVLGLSPQHERNLRRLATYLWYLPKSPFLKEHAFDMSHYTSTCREYDTHCGTSGCAVGHAPYAGIAKRRDEDWSIFADRTMLGGDFTYWQYLFSYWWTGDFAVCKDNTPKGAARRILYALAKGFPGTYTEENVREFYRKYRRYRPTPSEFGKLHGAVLRRLGLQEQPV